MSKVKRATNKKYNLIFEYLESGELEKILEELTEKQQEENAVEEDTKNKQEENKEEKETNKILEKYPELKSPELLKKIISKKKEIENVHEVIEILDEEAKRIENEVHRRESYDKLSEDASAIQEELKQYEEDRAKLKMPEDEKQIKEIEEKRKNANTKLLEVAEEQNSNRESSDAKYNESSTEELEKRYDKVQNKIGRFNLAFTNLLQGKSFDVIELNQDNFKDRTFSAKDGLERRKMQQKIEAAREENKDKHKTTDEILEEGKSKKENKKEQTEENKQQQEKQQDSKSVPVYSVMQRINNEQAQEKALIKKEEANEKHFSFGNIVNWIKNTKAAKFVKGVFNRNTVSNVTKADEIEKYKEDLVEEIINAEKDEFKARLKEISNDGINKMAENRMNANRITQRTNSRSNDENER